MNKYKNQITEQKAAFEEMVNFSANGLVYSDPGSAESKTWNAILDDYNNGTNNARQTVENGEIFYTFEGHKMSLKDIKKGLSKHDPEFQNRFQKRINDVVGQFKSLQEQGMEPTANNMAQMKSVLMGDINTLDQVRNLANAKFGNNAHSFEQILMGQAKTHGVNGHEMIDNRGIELIWAELDKLGGVDMDGNNVVDEKDRSGKLGYHNPENAKLLIEKIKEDKELYKELVVNFTMENTVKDFWAQGTMERVEAHRQQALKDQRAIDVDKQKKMNTARANVYASQQPTATQIRTDKRFKADDKSIRKMIETLDFKKMAGKKDRVVDLGNGTYDIYVDNVKLNTEPVDISKMGVENFGTIVYNAMMQKYEKTRITTYAQ